jgi:type IV secretion system protein TrbG
MRMRVLAVMVMVSALGASAQQVAVPPTGAAGNQNPLGAKPSPDKLKYAPEVLDTDKYPFAQAVEMLKQDPLARSTAAPSPKYAVPSVSTLAAASPSALPGRGTSGTALHPVILKREVPLNSGVQNALAQAEQLKAEPVQTTTGKDGRVLFTYGVGLPTVICAPLRVCTIELQPGEKIMGEPEIGDSTRWEIVPASSGTGDLLTPIIVLKPHTVGLDTNLVVTTDKRTYYLRLISKDTEYIARTAFTYKEDEDKRWAQYLAEQQQRTQQAQAQSNIVELPGDALEHLNFHYTVTGGSYSIRPLRVCDDGSKTYITMPDAVLHRELPTLIIESLNVKGEKGQEMVNYRVKGNMYIVDRLFDRAALLLGVGKKADKVEIRRDTLVAGGK